MRRKVSILLCMVLIFAMLPVTVSFGETAFGKEGIYNYAVENGEAKITACDKTASGAITIPSKLGGYPVIHISLYAFSGCNSLTSIMIPDSVTSIGNYAFSNCTGLTSITIPDSVTSIGNYVFSNCTGLTSIMIPDSVTSIGNYAFSGCSSLTSITIPDSVTSIGNYAFSNCTGLTSITIPDSVTSIGDAAFSYCTGLMSITVENKNLNYCSVDGNLFNKNKTTFIQYALGKIDSSYTIPNSVTSIGKYAFSGCNSLTSITIPDSMTSIGDTAFYNCNSLTSISIPDSVTNIGVSAFGNCSGLTSITIPDGVTSIGRSAFSSCFGLTSITIPNSVTTIGEYAFNGCEKLTSITIPEGVTSIERNTFYRCYGLTSLTIPDSVTSIGNTAFKYCSGLTSITIPDSVVSIGSGILDECSNLTDVYYTGSENQWEQISIDENNEGLNNAAIHFTPIYHINYEGAYENGSLFRGDTEIFAEEELKAGTYTYQAVPDDGYEVDTLSVTSGKNTIYPVLNANNEFEVTISEDTTIAVTFREKAAVSEIITDKTVLPDTVTDGETQYQAYLTFATITDVAQITDYGMYLNFPGGQLKLEGLTDEATMKLMTESNGKFAFRVYGKALKGKTVTLTPYITVGGKEETGEETEELIYQ